MGLPRPDRNWPQAPKIPMRPRTHFKVPISKFKKWLGLSPTLLPYCSNCHFSSTHAQSNLQVQIPTTSLATGAKLWDVFFLRGIFLMATPEKHESRNRPHDLPSSRQWRWRRLCRRTRNQGARFLILGIQQARSGPQRGTRFALRTFEMTLPLMGQWKSLFHPWPMIVCLCRWGPWGGPPSLRGLGRPIGAKTRGAGVCLTEKRRPGLFCGPSVRRLEL